MEKPNFNEFVDGMIDLSKDLTLIGKITIMPFMILFCLIIYICEYVGYIRDLIIPFINNIFFKKKI